MRVLKANSYVLDYSLYILLVLFGYFYYSILFFKIKHKKMKNYIISLYRKFLLIFGFRKEIKKSNFNPEPYYIKNTLFDESIRKSKPYRKKRSNTKYQCFKNRLIKRRAANKTAKLSINKNRLLCSI